MSQLVQILDWKVFLGGGGSLGTLAILPLMFVLLYFLMIRPEKKKKKEHEKRVSSIEVGDVIVTIGGVIGKIVNIKEDEITISTSVSNTLLTFRKNAISSVEKAKDAEASS